MKVLAKFFMVVVFSFMFMLNPSAEAVRGSLDCEFLAEELVVSRYSNGVINHAIYYANVNGYDVLIVLCHGSMGSGTYEIKLNGQYRSDYANAISELITYWNDKGKFRNISNIDIVLLGTCHAGYASNIILPQYVNLTGYNIPMVTVIDYKGKLYFKAFRNYSYDDQVSLRLYTDMKHKEPATLHSAAMAKFFGGSNVKGYRAVNEVVDIPEDAIELSGDF